MKENKSIKSFIGENLEVIISLIISTLFIIWFYFITKFEINNGLLINLKSVNSTNILQKLRLDALAMLLFPLIIILIDKNSIIKNNLKIKDRFICSILFIILILEFILHKDFSLTGVYKIFFYLVIVAFCEEFIFRGYLYTKLKILGNWHAIIISGIFFGIGHAILPGLLLKDSLLTILISSLSYIGGGIVGSLFFIYLKEKSESLIVPILIHALLDYNSGIISIGIIASILTFFYFFLKNNIKYSSLFKSIKNKNRGGMSL